MHVKLTLKFTFMFCTLQRTPENSAISPAASASTSHQIKTKKSRKLLRQTERKTSRSLRRPPRRIHYFTKDNSKSAHGSNDVKLTYFNVTMVDDTFIKFCFDDPDVVDRYGSDVDQTLASTDIDAATALSVVKRLNAQKKIVPGTVNAFSEWVKPHLEKCNASAPDGNSFMKWLKKFTTAEEEEAGINVFMVWYRDYNGNYTGHSFHTQDIFGKASSFVEELANLEKQEQEAGFVRLTTSRTETAMYVEPTLETAESTTDYSNRTLEIKSPTYSHFYPTTTFHSMIDRYIYILREWRDRLFSNEPVQFYEMDWVESQEYYDSSSLPYVTPISIEDLLSPSVVRLWAPVIRSANRAQYHIMRLETRFENLVESRFQPYYDINLSTIPVPGTYTFMRPV